MAPTLGHELEVRKVALESIRDKREEELKKWRDKNKGFTSVSRAGIGLALGLKDTGRGFWQHLKKGPEASGPMGGIDKASVAVARGFDQGRKTFWDTTWDPESRRPHPLRGNIARLEEKLALVESVIERSKAAGPPRAREITQDHELFRILRRSERGADPAPKELISDGLQFLEQAVRHKDDQEAFEIYIGLLAHYFRARTETGAGLHRTAKGRPSLTGAINQAIVNDALYFGERMVVTHHDLARIRDRVLRRPKPIARGLREAGRPDLAKMILSADREAFAWEIERLRSLERSPAHRELLNDGIKDLGKFMDALPQRPGILKRLIDFFLDCMDNPEGYMKFIIAKWIRMQIQQHIFNGLDIQSFSPKNLHGLVRGQVKSRYSVAAAALSFLAASAMHKMIEHVFMNIFHEVRGQEKKMDWTAGTFAEKGARGQASALAYLWREFRYDYLKDWRNLSRSASLKELWAATPFGLGILETPLSIVEDSLLKSSVRIARGTLQGKKGHAQGIVEFEHAKRTAETICKNTWDSITVDFDEVGPD